MTRRVAAVLALAVAVPLMLIVTGSARAATPEPPLRNADYFAFADHVAAALESSWSPKQGIYTTGARSIDTIANAAMLTVFATAAAYGHAGPARDDARARLLARRLTDAPPWYTAPRPPRYDKMFHTPGWTSNMDGPYVDMDKSIDPKVAEGLQIAYRTRDVLGLDAETVRRIREEIHAVSHVDFFRYPKVRLNQINWNSELYAYDWLVNGDAELLKRDYRRHVDAFTRGFKRPQIAGGAPNVGPSYRFTYQSNAPLSHPRNVDSAEYANMTLHFLYWYRTALQAGMIPLSREDRRLLRGWVQRDLYGYWTHAGFMNWDTGWSYERWMKGKAWAYAQQGLIAIAASPSFTRHKAESAYAKYLFDRGLKLYEHLGRQRPGRSWRPSAQLFGIGRQGAPATKMFWARMAANAARAVSAGLGGLDAKRPPPFYAYDADIGRVAVSTPRYSTAILAVNRGKVPYGGLDLARLYDADGDPISGTGGRPPSAFGVTVRSRGGRRLLATQTGLHHDPRRPAVVLTRSPRGRVGHQRRLATQPDAGPFGRLSTRGVRSTDGLRAVSRYTFRETSIDGHWTIAGPRLRSSRVTLGLPLSGRRGTIRAVRDDGRTRRVRSGGGYVSLRGIRAFELRGPHGGYRVGLGRDLRGAAHTLSARWQRVNPRGGPTLQLVLRAPRRGRLEIRARIVPIAAGAPDAADVAPEPTPTPLPEPSPSPAP